ncbi:low temperature requirement protein A [Nocardioides nitrophenolicus]|uniref:low temperature requirement protein A n=1 Tax=Nocardioides nitrophenolicus TaxID=60489 RepID=UPI000A81F8CF|nr:low temperature requirement protein A [Nocardioides nitrophenolicus]MBM7518633.1 low temperature requirement protein LtrA [Nocardioides nitrophenolicus]
MSNKATAIHRPMRARAVDEPNRTTTPLELLFDLTFVVAVGQAAGELAHATLGGHGLSAVLPFLMVFFAIWWAWMNFTWFASAYDTDDLPYRLAVFFQIGGVLVLAAGVGHAFDGDYAAVSFGYVIMRVGLLSLWLRAAVQHAEGRSTALRYAVGIAALEVLWLTRLATGDGALWTFCALVVLEMLVPAWAERAGPTNWHPHHIAERYSLFTIILLGESVFAATNAVVPVIDRTGDASLAGVSGCSLVIIAALWSLCFAASAGEGLQERRHWSFIWGYGYYLPFVGLAALGAGLEVVVSAGAAHGEAIAANVAVASVAVPVGVVIATVELLRVPQTRSRWAPLMTVFVGVVLGAAVVGSSHLGMTCAIFLVSLVAVAAATADAAINPRRRVPGPG